MSRLTYSEIDEIERLLGHKLPALYRRLLVEIGYGPVGGAPGSDPPFIGREFSVSEVKYGPVTGFDAVIYHPLAVEEIYQNAFEDPEELFNPYFPFGCQNITQELWVIDASREAAASVWHETFSREWENEEWLPYDLWIERYLKPELNKGAPTETP